MPGVHLADRQVDGERCGRDQPAGGIQVGRCSAAVEEARTGPCEGPEAVSARKRALLPAGLLGLSHDRQSCRCCPLVGGTLQFAVLEVTTSTGSTRQRPARSPLMYDVARRSDRGVLLKSDRVIHARFGPLRTDASTVLTGCDPGPGCSRQGAPSRCFDSEPGIGPEPCR
jgi:hypothetical protein